ARAARGSGAARGAPTGHQTRRGGGGTRGATHVVGASRRRVLRRRRLAVAGRSIVRGTQGKRGNRPLRRAAARGGIRRKVAPGPDPPGGGPAGVKAAAHVARRS